MKKTLIIATSLLMLAAVAEAQSVSVGGGYSTGHTYSSEDNVGAEATFRFSVEKDMFGVGYYYTPGNHMGLLYGKLRYEELGTFHPFLLGGVGLDQDGPLGGLGIGAEWWLTTEWALVPEFNVFVGTDRNYKQSTLSVKYHF
ncbi:MAG: hypothetical protein ACW99G_24045 [Candidatus Thorarchaeota archaeon]|jgi:hypothetical protein